MYFNCFYCCFGFCLIFSEIVKLLGLLFLVGGLNWVKFLLGCSWLVVGG